MGGPSIDQVNAASQNPIQRVHLANAVRPGPAQLANNSLLVYAPRVAPGTTGATGQPSHVWGSLGRTTVNRGVDVNRPLQVNQHVPALAPTPNEIEAARIAQQNAPQHSHIVTSSTPVSPPLQAPLSSLKPIAPATNIVSRNTFTTGQQPQVPGVSPGATTYHNSQGGVFNHTP